MKAHRLRVLAAGLFLLVGTVGSIARQAAPFVLPAPTGTFSIGATSWTLVDESREETFAPGTRRQVRVNAWYPAARGAGGTATPYLIEGPADVRTLGTLVRSPGSYEVVAGVTTHSRIDAPLLEGAERLPLLVFSHGYIGNPSSYTALLEDLASHGYVVLSVVHPYESTAATLADGTVVTLLDQAGGMRQPIRDVLAEWGPEDDTMTAVTRATDEAERLRLLRGYLSGLRHTDAALRRWVDDTRLVLDRLATPSSPTPAGRLATRIDQQRVGVFGHSMGGVTAAQFCVDDRRCRAGLNLDGIPQYGRMIDAKLDRPFLMVYSARPGRAGASDAIYRRAASPYYRVDVRDTLHLEFTDMPFWGGPLRERGAFGGMPPARATEITRTIVRQYFDEVLLGRKSRLLAGERLFPEVSVQTMR
jgi:pimeloyl-ACP methyl ester carboxylesterase